LSLQKLIILLLLFSSVTPVTAVAETDCHSTIQDFVFTGNQKIQPEYLLKWSKLYKGQQVSQQDLDQARQKILNTGYFSEVKVEHQGLCGEQTTIRIQIKEKMFFLAYPRLSRNGNGDIETGFEFRGYQLFAIDQNLSLLVSNKDYANGNTAKRFKADYQLKPLNLPYELRWAYQSSDTLLAGTTQPVTDQNREFSFLAGRKWHTTWAQLPIGVYAKMILRNKGIEGSDDSVTTKAGDYNTMGVQLEYDKVNDQVYRRTGRYHSIELTQGTSLLGSDFDAYRLRFESRYYHPLNDLDNLNMRFILDFTSKKIFNQYNYSVGGANSLRGIESGSISGNSLYLANIEYVIGYKNWPSFRTSLFTDIGNLSEDSSYIDEDEWRQTIGIGLRWKLKSFIKTDLVIDYAYDPDSNYSKFYLSTSLVF
jgi:outer membrane protein assembly factor BamA